ncbi:hypothetical protein [Aeoliella sp.]|uniref:hypothetical protein n=1 Tax=Aeoliella sp. TaxID=2795800 RepID=UPI003CCBB5F9
MPRKRTGIRLLLLLSFAGVLHAQQAQQDTKQVVQQRLAPKAPDKEKAEAVVAKKQEAEIRALVDQLVFAEGDATDQPTLSPGIRDNSDEYRERFERCQKAFSKLMEYKQLAFPVLVEHLDDKRQSINFRNHHMGNSVGDACYWNLYYQLQDRPEGYSRYGYMRKGRDGENHVKPYWEGTPFDEAGGIVKWLKASAKLNYTEKQIKCLKWLLEKEKKIGAADAESYFINILPLEIQILERRLENGEDVQAELDRLKRVSEKKLASAIPKELLPAQR